ncbi:hypothetical protein SNEBB_005215 [Seison nebaliae]|nr:hypothetical protein SNEBB_005215 [Seison nebaliae]
MELSKENICENHLLKLCDEPLLCFDSLLTSYSKNNVFYDEQNKQFFSIRSGGIIDITVRTLTSLALRESEKWEKSNYPRPYSDDETIPSLKIRLPDGVAISSIKFSPANRVLAIQRISLDSSIQIINIDGQINEFGEVESGEILQFQSSQIINLYSTQSLPMSSSSNQIYRLSKQQLNNLSIGKESKKKRVTGKIEEFFWLSDRDIVLIMNDRLEHFVLLFDRSTTINQPTTQNNIQNKKYFRLITSWTFHSIRWVKWSLKHSMLLLCLSNDKRSVNDQIHSAGDMFVPDYSTQSNSKLIYPENISIINGNSSNRSYSTTIHCPENADELTQLLYSKENLLSSDIYLQPILFLNGLLQRLPMIPMSRRLLRDMSLHLSNHEEVKYPRKMESGKSEKKFLNEPINDELNRMNHHESLNILFSTSNLRIDDTDISILTLYDRVYISLLCRYEKKEEREFPFIISDIFLFEFTSLYQPATVKYICRLPSSALHPPSIINKDFSLTIHSIDNLLILHHYSTNTSHLFDIAQQPTNSKRSPNYLNEIIERRKLLKKSKNKIGNNSLTISSSLSSSSTSSQTINPISSDKLNSSLNIHDISKLTETEQLSCSGRLFDDDTNKNLFLKLTNESLKLIDLCYPIFSPATIRPTSSVNSTSNVNSNEIILYSKGWRSFSPNIIIDVAVGAIWTLQLNFDQFISLFNSIDLQKQIVIFQNSVNDQRSLNKQRLNRRKRIKQLRHLENEENGKLKNHDFLKESLEKNRRKDCEIEQLNFNYLLLFHLIDFFTRRPNKSKCLEILVRKFFEKNSLNHLPSLKYFADIFDIQSKALRAKKKFEEKYRTFRESFPDQDDLSITAGRELLIYRLNRERNIDCLPSSIERLGLYNNFNYFSFRSSSSASNKQTNPSRINRPIKRQNGREKQFDRKIDSLTKDVDRYVSYSCIEQTVLFNIFNEKFEDWIIDEIRSNYFYSILIEYIRSFSEQNINISYFIFEILIQHLVRTSSFYQFHQNLQYQIFTDSKPLACILLSLEKIYSPAPYLSLDMFKRLNYACSRSHVRNEEFHDMIEILLNKCQVQDALQISRPLFTMKYLSQRIDGRKFIQTIIDQSEFDSHLFLNTFLFIFYRLDNVKNIIERGTRLKEDHNFSDDLQENFNNSNELIYRYIDYANYFQKFTQHFPSFNISKILDR